MEVCELDSDLVQVAERWFGFKRDSSSRMTVHIEDGVGFVKGRAASTEEIGKVEYRKFSVYTAQVMCSFRKNIRICSIFTDITFTYNKVI